MMMEMEKIDEIRSISKEQLIRKVERAKKDISMIGTIAFDLPWQDLEDALKEKFQKKDFTIHILRESETTIAQYSLITLGQEDANVESLSRGNLSGIKDKLTKDLKTMLSEATGGKNIEPPEDKYAEELGEVYYTEKRRYLLESYKIHGCGEAFQDYIKDCVAKALRDSKGEFLGDKQFLKFLEKTSLNSTECFDRYNREIEAVLSRETSEKGGFLASIETLLKMDNKEMKERKLEIVQKKGEKFLGLQLSVETEDICVKKQVSFDIDKWIEAFWMDETHEDVNYRLKADKAQALRKASDLRQEKLEEYRNDPEKKQRLFIRNCYMPIPIPMIKIDQELFITMALTKFDNISKFQYTGDVAIDEKTGICTAKEGREGYCSLWQQEFVNYYEEYFLNENGAQKYATEETAKGNRKEVIDIFDENRSRIGIGPRDAFLSNMAIVKSVVWALIFDRSGRVLIHQRKANAKDNQGLWDKSVGGHVSTEDLDTVESIKREITEELFTIENEGQGGHDIVQWMVTNKNKIIYLGDWKTSRFPDITALNLSKDEYYTFSLNYPDINKRDFRREIVVTERLLPNGDRVKAKCFVDAYLCIVSEDFDISKLQNSDYAMLTPNELKRCVLHKKIKINEAREYDVKNGKEQEFLPTSDLAYLVESAIWDDIVTEFARRIKETFEENSKENGK